MKSPSDAVVNIAILITCAILTTAILFHSLVRTGSNTSVPGVHHFTMGEAAESIPGVRYAEARGTLLLYIRSSCSFCTASMPFYIALKESVASVGRLRIVVVSSEDVETSDRYLRSHQLDVDDVIRFEGLPVPTPTLVLVDGFGTIRGSWLGQQDAEGEAAILAAIKGYYSQ